MLLGIKGSFEFHANPISLIVNAPAMVYVVGSQPGTANDCKDYVTSIKFLSKPIRPLLTRANVRVVFEDGNFAKALL